MLSIPLPSGACGAMCRFQWWQPLHSGLGHDVWAIDDISVTSTMYNTIDMQFESLEEGQQAVEIHLGELNPYCGRQHVLR
jgi:reelin